MDGSFGKTGMLCYLSVFLSALLAPSFFLRPNEVETRWTAKTDAPLLLSVYQKEMSGIFSPL